MLARTALAVKLQCQPASRASSYLAMHSLSRLLDGATTTRATIASGSRIPLLIPWPCPCKQSPQQLGSKRACPWPTYTQEAGSSTSVGNTACRTSWTTSWCIPYRTVLHGDDPINSLLHVHGCQSMWLPQL